ncbi:hypothetical protein HPB50_025854 [Hyalomma asiaticum]|uniref:Uncharacterized protein n=1 Tax=Hyalomma asiaticum TaxID=266040 RepID=A0ACB7TRC6_HYAAI|nr:hypothetical protein HPB50_025854 [Hyalomma asiaticum]
MRWPTRIANCFGEVCLEVRPPSSNGSGGRKISVDTLYVHAVGADNFGKMDISDGSDCLPHEQRAPIYDLGCELQRTTGGLQLRQWCVGKNSGSRHPWPNLTRPRTSVFHEETEGRVRRRPGVCAECAS